MNPEIYSFVVTFLGVFTLVYVFIIPALSTSWGLSKKYCVSSSILLAVWVTMSVTGLFAFAESRWSQALKEFYAILPISSVFVACAWLSVIFKIKRK